MKTTTLYHLSTLTTVGLLITAMPAIADDYALMSVITDVTVYPSSARIIRSATLDMAAGNHTLVIADLPTGLLKPTLRIQAPDGSDITLGHADLREKFQSERSLAQAEQIETDIKRFENDLAKVEDKIYRLDSQIELVQALGYGDGDSAYQQLPMDQWQQAWQLLESQVAQYQRRLRAANEDKTTLEEQIALAERQLASIGNDPRSVYEASVDVYSPKDQTLELTVTYQINNAYWSPLYDVNLDSETEEVTIDTFATVQQSTDENWDNVNLKLSTYRPNANAQLPSLWPWTLSLYEPGTYGSSFAAETMDMAVASAPMVRSLEEKKADLDRYAPAPVAIISSDYRTDYIAPKPVSLSSGNQDKRIALQSQTFAGSISTIAVPQIHTHAMIVSSVQYDGGVILLPGNASLYMDNQFVGEHSLPATQPGEKLELSMGEDDKVRVTYQPDPDQKSESGVFSKEKTIESHFLVRIDNQHDEAKPITIKGHFPVGEDDDIQVKRLGDQPSRTDLDDKKGVVAWDYTIEPGAEQQLKFGYRVSYPADSEIDGL